MDRALLTAVVVAALVAGLVAAGASYVAVSSLTPKAMPPASPPAGNHTAPLAPNATAANDTRAAWAFTVRGELPQGPGARGTVVVFLGKVQGDANASSLNGSIPVEVAAVAWDASTLAPPLNGTILEAMNAQFTRVPPVALARAALSRDQDAVELTVPGGLNVSTIIINAPATGGFLAIAWPSGAPYAWNEETRTWGGVREPTLLARPLAAA